MAGENTLTGHGYAVRSDVHTHVYLPEHQSAEFKADLLRAWPEGQRMGATFAAHAEHARAAARSVVLAFDARNAGWVTPDEFVAEYVASDDRLVGFCSIDPMRDDSLDRLARAVEELGLRGVKLAPTYQGFDPLSARAFELYEAIANRHLPILWHQGTTFVRRAVLAYAPPRLLDDIALRFPETPMVIAHCGHPWIEECLAVVRKHPLVFADISALAPRPDQFRRTLVAASEYRCDDKLLFGTDFPFDTIGHTTSCLNALAEDPQVHSGARAAARGILSRDGLAMLGL